jgi:hypothetical protein
MSEPFQLQVSDVPELHVESMSDEEVLALADVRFSDEEDDELSELLELNREGEINSAGHQRLDELMRIYQIGLHHKSQALREAVLRGLREPLR